MSHSFSALGVVLAAACAAAVVASAPVPAHATDFDDQRPSPRFALIAPDGPLPVKARPLIVAVPKDNDAALLARPVPGAITSPYGLRMHPILHYVRLHAGVDLHAQCGTSVKAAAAGTVSFAGWGSGSGYRVEIDHSVLDGHQVTTTYSHLRRVDVTLGDHIAKGDVLGEAGSTGLSTGCHLHFEVHVAGTPVDPATFFTSKHPLIRIVVDVPRQNVVPKSSATPRIAPVVPIQPRPAPTPKPAQTPATPASPAPPETATPQPSPSAT